MKCVHGPFGSNKQEGGSTIFLISFVALFIAGIVGLSQHIVRSRYKSVALGSVGQTILTNVMGRVRLGLSGQSSCPTLDNGLRPFRNFSTAASPFAMSQSGPNISAPCLLTADEAKNITNLDLNLVEVANDPNALSKSLRVSIRLTVADQLGKSPARKVNLSHGFTMRVASLDQFSVVFTGSETPLVTTTGPKVAFTGPVFHSNSRTIPITDLYSAPAGKLVFRDTFYVRSRFLSSSTSNLDMGKLKNIFTKGIETDVLNSPVLNNFLPRDNTAWHHGFDYSYINSKSGYPVPQTQNGIASFDCTASTAYDNSRGSINTIPSTGSLDKASLSCAADSLMIPVVQYMNPVSSLTVNLGTGDNVFCGLVVANQLRINMPNPGKYAIFGHFLAGSMSVSGSPDAELYIYSPNANGQVEVQLPAGMGVFRGQVKSLASSTAYNFFLPIAANTPFLPRDPDSYMPSCGNGYRHYNTNYQPLDAQAGFSNLQLESAGPLYIVESVL